MSKENELITLIGSVNPNKVDLIKKLIQDGVDLNYVLPSEDTYAGYTPLMLCINTAGIGQFDVDAEVFKLLIDNGADTSMTDDEGNTPVLIAVKYFALDILRLLIQKGASIYDQNDAGENAFNIIIARYEEEQQLDEENLFRIPDAALQEDIRQGMGEAYERMLERIDAIVENGYDLNTGDESAAFQAITAISEERLPADVLTYLFEKGANARECTTGPLLDYALFRKLPTPALVSMIQTIGLEYTFDCFHNFTPINIVAIRNNTELATQLIELGADIHLNNDQPLRNACKLGRFEMVQCLVSSGANMHAADEKGNTPLHYARELNFTAIVDYLEKTNNKE